MLEGWIERALARENPAAQGVRSDADLNKNLGQNIANVNSLSEELDRDLSDLMMDAKPASVLVPVVMHKMPTVLLTKRNQSLTKHAGQVSFPGGRIDPQDASADAAALRETYEEVGISSDFISLKGTLDTYYTGTGFEIIPVVATLRPGFTINKHDAEVEEVFEVPLDFILNRANHKRESAIWKGMRRHYYSIPYEDYYIWGATAAMLVNLVDLMEAVQHR
jgi:8-oxo-dGTP pyrophosphatase MutT (NUDIX family)